MSFLDDIYASTQWQNQEVGRDVIFDREDLERRLVAFCEGVFSQNGRVSMKRYNDSWWSGNLYAAYSLCIDGVKTDAEVRISKIGRLASILPEADLDPVVFELLRTQLLRAGFVYVEEKYLRGVTSRGYLTWEMELFNEA